jgi:hypothetical protein
MAQQSSNGNRPRLNEKGLLTPDNCVVALIDTAGTVCIAIDCGHTASHAPPELVRLEQ